MSRSFFFTGLRAVFFLRLLTTNTGHDSVTALVMCCVRCLLVTLASVSLSLRPVFFVSDLLALVFAVWYVGESFRVFFSQSLFMLPT